MSGKTIGIVAAIVIVVIAVPLLPKLMGLGKSGQPAAAATGAPAQTKGSSATTVATEVVSALSRGDTAAVAAKFDADMQAALPADQLRALWAQAEAQLGKFKRQVGAREQKVQGQDVVFVTCEFERGKVDFQVAVNSAGQISGLYVKPPSQ